MRTGRKIFATISLIDGKIVVDVGNSNYTTITLKDGTVCVVERESQSYFPIEDKKTEI